MGNELIDRIGRYWVIFYQPLPESGERIAISLVFSNRDGAASVEYDPTFSKALKLYPDLDRKGLAFYLDSLRRETEHSPKIESVLNSYGPQLSVSSARKIAAPIERSAVDMLLARYVYPSKAKALKLKASDDAAKEIAAFVRNSLGSEVELHRGVKPQEILGHALPGAKPVAVAIRDQAGWTIMDGVDLNTLTVGAATSKADEIGRTYWNYGRIANESGVRIRKVGIVLNGHSHLSAKTHEAHDYALHRFQVESDLAIDSSSTESGDRLRDLFAKVL